MCNCSTVLAVLVRCVSTFSTLPRTVTVSVAVASGSWIFIVAAWPTVTVTFFAVDFPKPGAVAVTLYTPGGRFESWYAPSAVELVERSMPLSAFVAVTVAFATMAFFGSLTAPLRFAVAEPCAIAAMDNKLTTHITAVSFISFIFMASAFVLFLGITCFARKGAALGTHASAEMNGSFLPHLKCQSNNIRA